MRERLAGLANGFQDSRQAGGASPSGGAAGRAVDPRDMAVNVVKRRRRVAVPTRDVSSGFPHPGAGVDAAGAPSREYWPQPRRA